ncbi:hypothetical protein Kpol_1061p39 [Vanderwaltozyma polyspora DSM 70294]|uniref:Calcium-transporting ATPase n=1 Tax=Vanderwaltozyma polyspora (strain ATCC 22028 / DSM 70294 / BCRC 21397 / CBS 2163 / NBRC 10782 / NRRL Y-8283 / UCD 57-17) TaxID=436907 RepID=A7TJG4_VANPO|nr:uncharacterized protein Kpol_1061p39 [Vanderwaltozyma polyspora DSM 70294]EDO17614.1 hypothetical protein Kpol_1061p39 [Vanderwaltozyma polyspora DSM 70294]
MNNDDDDLGLVPDKVQLSTLHDPKSIAQYLQIFHSYDPNVLYQNLQTDPINGIDSSQLHTRKLKYGDNKLPEHVSKTFMQLILEALNDKTMILLSIAAIVSFLLGLYEVFCQPTQYDPEGHIIKNVDWIEGIAIMLAVVVVVVVSAANDYQKEKQFSKLSQKKENDKTFTVIRDTATVSLIPNSQLVVGDIIKLQTGDILPADCILVSGCCDVDESSVTGESDTIKKRPLTESLSYYKDIKNNASSSASDFVVDIPNDKNVPDCMLISGSKVIAGLGKAVVTAVGISSVHGRTMNALIHGDRVPDEDAELNTDDFALENSGMTPMQERLSNLADIISVYGCLAATLLFVILFAKYLYNILSPNGRFKDLPPAERGNKFLNIFITSVTIIVVAVPEGLPLAVTLALAFATTKMTKDGNLVRILKACETMGSATAICSDKTGTLTRNSMTVTKVLIGGKTSDNLNEIQKELGKDILINIALNSTAFENKNYKKPPSSSNPFDSEGSNSNEVDTIETYNSREPYIGSKTEIALLSFANLNLDLKRLGELQKVRNEPNSKFPTIEKIVQIIPFESSRKWSGLVVKLKDTGTYRLYVKGAAEIIFKKCSYRRGTDGSLQELDENVINNIQNHIKDFAENALRAISLAHKDLLDYKTWPPAELMDKDKKDNDCASPDILFNSLLSSSDSTKFDETGLVIDGIFGIQDPLRPGVDESVKQCQESGVTVRMVTGDNLLTAKAIARNCHILTLEDNYDPHCAMEGPEFRKLTKEERVEILPKLRVLARSSPEDKRLLVGTLKSMGDIVAVTGDGTNDAPALKLADVGFSMGISGTEVAREASDIILMTDDFSSIVNAIKWGRCVSTSIKKFIQFQLTVNITAVFLTFVSAILSEDESSVLTAVQLLWVNLIMDTLAALALATDKPDKDILKKKPKGRSEPLISFSTWKMILAQAALQLTITFILKFYGANIFFGGKDELSGKEQQQLNAMIFNTFVWLQFFTMIVSRKLDEADGITGWKERCTQNNLNFFQDLFRNYYFIAIMTLIGVLQILIMFYGGIAFSIERQTREMWIVAILCGMLSLPVGVIVRIIPDDVVRALIPASLFAKFKYILYLEFLPNWDNKPKEEDEESLLEQASNVSTRE